MLKKLICFVLTLTTIFTLFVGCNNGSSGDTDERVVGSDGKINYNILFPDYLDKSLLVSNESEYLYSEKNFGLRSLNQMEKIYKVFYNEGTSKFKISYVDADVSEAYLWDFGAIQTMTAAVAKANPDSQAAKEKVQLINDKIELYADYRKTANLPESLWKADGGMYEGETRRADAEWMRLNREVLKPDDNGDIAVHYYNSTTSLGDPFYDDNVWCAIGFIDAAKALKGDSYKEYYQKAEKIMFYIFSGWDFRQDGGILWKENYATKNTCINGPAAYACTQLYNYYASDSYIGDDKELRKDFYLKWATEIYDWTFRKLYDPASGVFLDNLAVSDGAVNTSKFSYNVGTMLMTAAELYSITEESKYLEEAQTYVSGAYLYFVSRDSQFVKGLDIYGDMIWFNLYLFRGYIGLAKITGDYQYVDKVKEMYDYAWSNARDYYGFIKRDITGRKKNHSLNWKNVEVIHVAANTEIMAMLAAV